MWGVWGPRNGGLGVAGAQTHAFVATSWFDGALFAIIDLARASIVNNRSYDSEVRCVGHHRSVHLDPVRVAGRSLALETLDRDPRVLDGCSPEGRICLACV